MDTKNSTSILYKTAKQAAIYEDNDALDGAVQEARDAGLDEAEITRQLIAVGLAVGDLKALDGKAKESFKRKDADALQNALDFLGFEVRYNVRAARTEVRLFGEWTAMVDTLECNMRSKIGEIFTYITERGARPLDYGNDRWHLCLNAILHNHRVDPFKVWIESLPAWDGVERLDHYLPDVFGAERDALTMWAGQFLVLGPIQRAYEPGAKLDEMPVLVGDQGIGKSTLLSSILPGRHRAEWFADGLHLAAEPKTRAESLLGRVIVECGEMAGSTRAELESLKAFITRQDDGAVRLSYRRNPETMLRRCVIVGTTNRRDSLPNDPSGNRRFVPIDLPEKHEWIGDYMEKNRGGLWAEALNRYRGGMRARLPEDLHSKAGEVAEKHRNRDALLEDRIEALTIGDDARLVEIAEAVGLLSDVKDGARLGMRDTKRLTAGLRNHGWSEYRNERSRRWKRAGNHVTFNDG